MLSELFAEIIKVCLKHLEGNKIKSKKNFFTVSRVIYEMWDSYGNLYGCSICEKEFKVNDNVILLLNGRELFPNCYVHQKCWSNKTDNILQKKYKKNKWVIGFCPNRKSNVWVDYWTKWEEDKKKGLIT